MMNELMNNGAPEILLLIRFACHILICLIVAFYTSEPGHHRVVIGYASGIFAGANAAEAFRIWVHFSDFIQYTQPWLTLIMAGVLYFVVLSGGNMSRFLPRKIVERLP